MLPWCGHRFESWASFQLLTIFPFAIGFKKSFLSSDITWVFRMRLPTLTDVVMGRQLALLIDIGRGWLKQDVTGRIGFCSSRITWSSPKLCLFGFPGSFWCCWAGWPFSTAVPLSNWSFWELIPSCMSKISSICSLWPSGSSVSRAESSNSISLSGFVSTVSSV